MPPGAVKCDRTGRWGNPWKVGERNQLGAVIETRAEAVAAYRADVEDMLEAERIGIRIDTLDRMRRDLRGKNLGCWCPEPAPGEADQCHASVILEIANA